MGFPLSLSTNSEHILGAAEESWSMFPERFATPPLRLRLGVINDGEMTLPLPSVRAQGNLISFIGNAANFSIGDTDSGFGFGWLSSAVVQNREFARYHYLDSLTLALIDSLYVCNIHAACVVIDGRGILLCGEAGAGKSTLAYACAKRGAGYVSDDSSFLRKGPMDRVVIGNPHCLRLRPDAGRLFPEFQDRLIKARSNGKLSMEIATADEPQINRVAECEIHHVVFLKREEGAIASTVPFSKEAALAELSKVISFGSQENRMTRIAHYRNLLEVPAVRMGYGNLDHAVDCLANIAGSQA